MSYYTPTSRLLTLQRPLSSVLKVAVMQRCTLLFGLAWAYPQLTAQ